MKFARALLASFGAGTSIVLAGTLAMASLSAVVAFRGLPGLDSVRSARQAVAVLPAATSGDDATTAGATGAPVTLVAARRTGSGATLATIVRRGQSQLASPGRTSTAIAGLQSSVTTIRPSITQTTRPGSLVTASAPAATPATPSATDKLPLRGEGVSEPVRKAGRDLGGAVATTGDALGDTVAPVAPALAPTVTDVTSTVSGVVQGTTDAVGAVVDGLTGVVVP